jgi:hypothetical protein
LSLLIKNMIKNFIDTLNISKNQNLCIINMPVSLSKELEILPSGVTVTPRPIGKFDQVILFTNTKEELTLAWDRLFSTLKNDGYFWIIFPNKKSILYNEIDDTFLDELFILKNIIPSKKITIFSDWNGQKIIKNDQS